MSVSCLAAGAYASDGSWFGGYEEDDVDLAWFTENQDADEFYIGTAKQFAGLAALLSSERDLYAVYSSSSAVQSGFIDRTVFLTADIDLAAVEGVYWRSMGDIEYVIGTMGYYQSITSGAHFKGTFDGQGHMVRYIGDPDDATAGLFSILSEVGTIKNLSVDARISIYDHISSSPRRYAGGITLVNEGRVSDCFVSADISSSISQAGGITAINRGTIRNCAVSGVLSPKVDSSFFL
jgi:hypothetical protein